MNKKIKGKNILYISKTMDFGGTEKVVLDLAKYFNNKFKKVIVVSSGGIYVSQLRKSGIKHYTIGNFERKNPINLLNITWRIFKIINREKIDVVHSHHRFSNFLCYYLKKIINFKLITTAHTIFYDKKILTRYGNNIVAVGNDLKNNLANYYNIKREDITVIHSGVSFCEPGKLYQDKIIDSDSAEIKIGTIGRLSREKGINYLIRALPDVIEQCKKITLYIIGDGSQKKYLTEIMKNLNLEGNIIFTGYVKDINKFLPILDFLVFPSLQEGFPLTILEVLSAGKPVIASSVKGITEIIKHNENGLLVKPKDIKDISDAIIWMINNPDRRKEMGKRGRRMVRSNYSLKGMFEKYEAYYNKIL